MVRPQTYTAPASLLGTVVTVQGWISEKERYTDDNRRIMAPVREIRIFSETDYTTAPTSYPEPHIVLRKIHYVVDVSYDEPRHPTYPPRMHAYSPIRRVTLRPGYRPDTADRWLPSSLMNNDCPPQAYRTIRDALDALAVQTFADSDFWAAVSDRTRAQRIYTLKERSDTLRAELLAVTNELAALLGGA